MEARIQTSTTSASALFTGAIAPRVAVYPVPAKSDTQANRETRRKGERFAWIVIAAIWVMSAISFYVLWAKTNPPA